MVLVADSAETTGLKWVDLAYLNANSGSAQVNYIKNPNATYDTSGWATFNDGTGTITDGTGGTFNGFFAGSDNIRGNAFIFAGNFDSYGNPNGSGVSYDFTIDAFDKNKELEISFDYYTDDVGVSITSSSFRVYLYDKDNSALISTYSLINSGNTYHIPVADGINNSTRWIGRFKAASTSDDYRLIIQCQQSLTSGQTLAISFDNVYVGPELRVPNDVLESSSTSLAAWGITANQWGDFTSLSLTPGIWDLSGVLWLHNNGAVTAGDFFLGTGSTSGNTAPSGGTPVDSTVSTNEPNSGYYNYLAFSNVIKTVTTTTTYYLKAKYDASVTNIRRAYRFTARRVK